MSAPLAQAHILQNRPAWLLRQIQVDNREIGTRGRLSIDSLDKRYRLLAVGDDNELAFNPCFSSALRTSPALAGLSSTRRIKAGIWLGAGPLVVSARDCKEKR